MPLFTILINAYNYGHYIEQAIQSALSQTIPRELFEVLVIDDGSTDGTKEVVAGFGDTVRYHFQENAGQAAAFNAGLLLAQGQYIAFLDADDFFAADKLQLVREFLHANQDVDLLYHPLVLVDAAARKLGVFPQSSTTEVVRLPMKAFINGELAESLPTSGMVARTKMLHQLFPVPLTYRICADSYIHNTAPLIATAIGYVSKPLAYYRLHANNNFCMFDFHSGRYASKDDKLSLEKIILDLQGVESVAARFDIDVVEYLQKNYYNYLVQRSVCIRAEKGILPSLDYIIRNLNYLKHMQIAEKTYRMLSLFMRLVAGQHVFRFVAGKFLGSYPHRLIHKLLYELRADCL